MGKSSELEFIKKSIVDEQELRFVFLRASGPGGQNVNKVASGVQLRFDVGQSPSLSDEMRSRLMQIARNRINEQGILIIEAKRFRTQEQNRQDAVDRLVELIGKASETPKPRKRSLPTEASRLRRLEAKHQRSEIKRLRAWKPDRAE